MCLAMPGKIVSIQNQANQSPRAKVDFGGVLKDVSLACLPDAKVGEYVIVHVGIALSRLDEKHRLVFLLRDVEGFSVRETAAALGLSEANVKVRLLRARLQLREDLTRVFGDADRRLTPGHNHAP